MPCLYKKQTRDPTSKGQQETLDNSKTDSKFVSLIFCKLRKRDPFGVLMRWVLVIKDHATGLIYLCALSRKCPYLVAYKLQEIFGIIGFPKIFHTDNEKDFTTKLVLKFLCQMNPNIISVTGQPLRPSDQGLVEDMNKLAKRVIGSVLTKQRLVGDNPNWTAVLDLVAAVINSQHGCKKEDISSYEAVYGQEFDHEVSCSEEEARWCWTLPQLLKITNNTEFPDYVSSIYHLDDGFAADDENDNGYFSDQILLEDERDAITDEDFLKHLVTPDSLGVNDRKRPHDEDLTNHRCEDNQSLEENDRRCWRNIKFNESNKSPEHHPTGVQKRKSPPESLHDDAMLVNHFVDCKLHNDTEIKDNEEPYKIVASTSIALNSSHSEEEFNDPRDDTWVQDTPISDQRQSVKIDSYSLAEA